MSIPNEIKIGILGAGGKMGMHIGANLKKLPNEIFYIENAEAGIRRLEESGIEVSEPATGIGLVDVLILAVPDILISKISTEVVPDIKSDATVILLDPAAAYMNQVCIREDLHYTVIHPCHPALFKNQPTLEGYNDHFGGKATPTGTFFCGLFLVLLVTVLQIAGYQIGTQYMIKGLLLLLVVIIASKSMQRA